MNNVKSVELSIRAAMIVKPIADIIGCKDVIVAKLSIRDIKEQIAALEKFLNTAEVDK